MSASLSSPPEVQPLGRARCRHFGTCGGCATQHLPYEDQLRAKTGRIERALEDAGIAARPMIHPSPQIWFYRNKMEFSVMDIYPQPPVEEPQLRLGLKPKGRWYEVLDLEECFLLSPETPRLLAATRRWARENHVFPYNSRRRTGVLRNLVVREAKNEPERLVLLVTTPADINPEPFCEAALAAYPATTILRGVHAGVSDTAALDPKNPVEIWRGPGFITETLRFGGRKVSFRLSPQSFFQTNTKGAEILYGILRDWLKVEPAETVLDLYCGAGSIGLSLADICGLVIGAEINPLAIEDAKANAALNGIVNAEFIAGPAENLAPGLLSRAPGLVIVDPPRPGLHPRMIKEILARPPERIFYVSCNPDALARDLKLLAERFVFEAAEVVDLFPHTEHVETAVRLRRRLSQ